jgi:hypothetical protein
VDSWLGTIESKFKLLHCTEYQKTLYATYQLRGSARAYWASDITALPANHHVPWGKFHTIFRAHHLYLAAHITYLWDSSAPRWRSSWTLSKGTTVYLTIWGSSTPLLSTGHTTSTQTRRRPTCTVQDSPSTCKSAWYSSPAFHTMSWWVRPLIKREWWRPLSMLMRRRGKRWCLDPLVVVVLVVLLPSTTWCIPHLGVSSIDHNSSRIGAIAHSSNHSNSNGNSHNNSSNNNNSTVLLLAHHSRLPSGRQNSFPPATFHASTTGRWGTLLENDRGFCTPRRSLHHSTPNLLSSRA